MRETKLVLMVRTFSLPAYRFPHLTLMLVLDRADLRRKMTLRTAEWMETKSSN